MVSKLKKYQEKGVRKIDHFKGRVLLADEQGLGKAQPCSSRVLTPNGWKRIGALAVGDMVIGSNGKATPVLGVYPQGRKDIFRVWFRDGSSTRCCKEHLWAVWSPAAKWNGYKPKVKPLQELMVQLLRKSGEPRFHIPIVKPVDFHKREVPLDPYLLGCLLGDGSLVSMPDITTADIEIVEAIGRALPNECILQERNQSGAATTYRIVSNVPGWNVVRRSLKELGLLGHRSHTKFVPDLYRFNSQAVRLAVLQGLMDTDGYVSNTGTVQFCSTSKKLAKHVRELVWSFGGTCTMNDRNTHYTYKGEHKAGRKSYLLTIALPSGINPFRLQRKSERYPGRPKYLPCRAMVKIEPAGKEECVCIKVAAEDQLYVTDNYILTHNTPQALHWVKNHPELWPVVVVCPASLKVNWQREAAFHVGMRAEILEGTRPSRLGFHSPPIVIINYDILKPWMRFLKELRPKVVIYDEAQYVKNPSSLRTKQLRRLCKGVRHILALSGTPLTSRPSELWPTLNILRPTLFPSFASFAVQHCKPRRTPWGWTYKGAEKLDELHATLSSTMMIRRTKAQVLKELPPKQRVVVTLPIEDRKQYDQAVRDFAKWARDKLGKRKAKKALKVEQMAKIGYLLRLAAELKMKAIHEWLDMFLENSDEKLLVFGIQKAILKGLHERYKKISVLITGEVTGHKRQLAVDQLQKNPKIRFLFGNVIAAGMGLNLTAANNTAGIEFAWAPGDHRQNEDRAHRIGQKKRVTCFYLVAEGTIEERMCDELQRRQKVLDAVLDGGKVDDRFDIYDILTQHILEQSNGHKASKKTR